MWKTVPLKNSRPRNDTGVLMLRVLVLSTLCLMGSPRATAQLSNTQAIYVDVRPAGGVCGVVDFDGTNLSVVQTFNCGSAEGVAVNSGGTQAVTSDPFANTLYLWDLTPSPTGPPILIGGPIPAGVVGPEEVAISPDGTFGIVSGTLDGAISRFEISPVFTVSQTRLGEPPGCTAVGAIPCTPPPGRSHFLRRQQRRDRTVQRWQPTSVERCGAERDPGRDLDECRTSRSRALSRRRPNHPGDAGSILGFARFGSHSGFLVEQQRAHHPSDTNGCGRSFSGRIRGGQLCGNSRRGGTFPDYRDLGGRHHRFTRWSGPDVG